ncbi:hypothetical protein FB45DRAFT_1025692 [Roridomyces roridus]|uniref:Uncharacterized protein n=1 Tax=Roridomyces roridus TaxID=1738132 RepID=A0AAD7C0Y3_9AGAR|nr:hypothetical protein FB45DRAFT_1025692 [Roridomyces roridus]
MSSDSNPAEKIAESSQEQPVVQDTPAKPDAPVETANKDEEEEEEEEFMDPPKPPLDTPRGKVNPTVGGKPKPKPR